MLCVCVRARMCESLCVCACECLCSVLCVCVCLCGWVGGWCVWVCVLNTDVMFPVAVACHLRLHQPSKYI